MQQVAYVGIDVQVKRGCCFAVLDAEGRMLESGWLPVDEGLERDVASLSKRHSGAIFGIDAPRQPLPALRRWYWRGGRWCERGPSDRGFGRHCEVVVRAHSIANPQWTPLASAAPEWMTLGFRLFALLEGRFAAHEVFPSASYAMLEGDSEARLSLSLADFRPGPKDMLDAAVAALSVLEHDQGRGQEVGGGDGLGTIVLPRPIARPIDAVLRYPLDPPLSPDPGAPRAR